MIHVFFHNNSYFVKAIDMPSYQHLSVTLEEVISFHLKRILPHTLYHVSHCNCIGSPLLDSQGIETEI